MKNIFLLLSLFCISYGANAQDIGKFADNVRTTYHIPELGFAVVSADSVYEMNISGVTKINTTRAASLKDRFRIGSNTKVITGIIAAQLVHQQKISWDTRFFDLFPELKAGSNTAYHNLTLLNLLSFRTRLYAYTYTYRQPVKGQFAGTEEEQRYQFAGWFFKKEPVHSKDSIQFSNLGYIAAGLMLEKVSGKPYKQLVNELGTTLGVNFYFGQPNSSDTLQTWGHGEHLEPEPPGDNYKLDWLLPAGNINMTLPGFAKFIQAQIKGLQGRDAILSAKEFDMLCCGLPVFSVGWFWEKDKHGHIYVHNEGNPGTFLTMVYILKNSDRAYILFSNAQTDEAEEGMHLLLNEMEQKWGY